MKYINPFFSFQPFIDPDKTIEEQMPLLRKKILSEIALSSDGYIMVEGQTFTKNDVLKYFEALRDMPHLDHYALIAKDNVLHGFLSGDFPLKAGGFKTEKAYRSEDFISFISPMYKTSYTNYIIKAFQSSVSVQGYVFTHHSFLNPSDKNEAYSLISSFLENNNNRIGEYKRKIKAGEYLTEFRKDILMISSENYVRYLNLLPDDFDNVRDSYATELTNLGVALENKERTLARMIFQNISNVRCNPELTNLLSRNNEALSVPVAGKKTGSNAGATSSIIVTIIIIINILSRLSNNSNRYHDDRSSNDLLKQYMVTKPSKKVSVYVQTLNTRKMLADIMLAFEAYQKSGQTLADRNKKKTDLAINQQLVELTNDSVIAIKYAGKGVDSYRLESLNINNNTSYDLCLFYTRGNTLQKRLLHAHDNFRNDFNDNMVMRFYVGKNFDPNGYIEFMGKPLNGIFKTTDQNTLKLLKIEFSGIKNDVSNLTLTEKNGVVSLQ